MFFRPEKKTVRARQTPPQEKAKLIEQACAYVKQEAEVVKQAAFTAAFEKMQAKAIEKQKAEEQRIAQAGKERQERLKREEERVRARERQKNLLQEEKEAKKAEKQLAARALKKNGLLLEVQQKAKGMRHDRRVWWCGRSSTEGAAGF